MPPEAEKGEEGEGHRMKQLTEADFSLSSFFDGTAEHAQAFFGACLTEAGIRLRLYAPHALSAEVLREDGQGILSLTPSGQGVFEGTAPRGALESGVGYRYTVTGANGEQKSYPDPYALQTKRIGNEVYATVDRPTLPAWRDSGWLSYAERTAKETAKHPWHAYEVHAATLLFGCGREKTEHAVTELMIYAKRMGYTHLCLMPLGQNETEGAWGYQPICPLAPAAEVLSPEGVAHLVGAAHEAGLGVLMDTVPPADMAEGASWSLWLTACTHWLTAYHLDGLRLCYVRELAQQGHAKRLCYMTERLHRAVPRAVLVSDAPTADVPVLGTEGEALGFDLAWSRTWREQTLSFLATAGQRGQLCPETSGRELLALSHDDVCPPLGSLFSRVAGDESLRLAVLRAYMAHRMWYVGKKLTFMGCDVAWNEAFEPMRAVPWGKQVPTDRQTYVRCMASLGQHYLACPALWGDGMRLLASGEMLAVYERYAPSGETVTALINLTERVLTWPPSGKDCLSYEVLFSTDRAEYGGMGRSIETTRACVSVPPYTAMLIGMAKNRA